MTGSLARAVWRWHFCAGLIVMPMLAWLAVTGGLYLYKPEIERAVYAGWLARGEGADLPLATIAGRVEAQTGGRVTQVTRPAEREAWRLTVTTPEGDRTAFVDPATGRISGMTRKGGVMATVKELHSLIIAGPIANTLVEIVAGWAIVLVLTGFWLRWPRRGGKALALRGRPEERRFWRDLHASTGAVAGALILFLALSGMMWTGVWGKGLQTVIAAQQIGRPKPPGPTPWEHGHHAKETLPWSHQEARPPHGHGQRIGPDRVAAVAAERGFAPPWTLTFPAAAEAPWLIATATGRAEDARVLYLDGADGRVLQDARYAAFGPGAKLFEWSIAAHQGTEFGEANRLLMLATALAVLLLAVSGPVMWWKRRPARGWAPAPRGDARATRGVAAIMLAVGVLFPLTGLTMVAALIGETLRKR